MTWRDNPFFPKVLEEERQYLLSRDTEAYQNVWEGKCRLAVKGALWTYEMIDSSRLAAVPAGVELNRAVVAIDPSVTEEGNEAGIICAARGSDNRGYVLADRTLQGRPEAWARRAVDTWHMFRCDRIVAEANNGGQMIESTINAYDRTVPIKLVNASRGKITRAEPISLLYSRGLISHVGTFTDLEREMCSYSELDVGSARASPNRMDALVWALTELFEVGPVNLDAAFISGNLRTMEEFPA
jgi:phage terminase large subunit-like protein